MKRIALLLVGAIALAAAVAAQATIVADVRALIAKDDLAGAERLAAQFRADKGNTPEALVALSWVGRGALAAGDNAKAAQVARQTHDLALQALKTRALDADTLLPTALGAAIETEAKAMVATGQRATAVGYLRQESERYKATSIRGRLQKNLLLLSLEGTPAPTLTATEFLGPVKALPAMAGRPVLLFFWAHWCPDCKAQGPIIADLQQKYKDQGFLVVGPTRRYGYAARGEDAGPAQELAYIEQVRSRFYGSLEMAVPVSNEDALSWGMDSTPTLVLIDRGGRVAMYHPGQMTREELEPRIQATLGAIAAR